MRIQLEETSNFGINDTTDVNTYTVGRISNSFNLPVDEQNRLGKILSEVFYIGQMDAIEKIVDCTKELSKTGKLGL